MEYYSEKDNGIKPIRKNKIYEDIAEKIMDAILTDAWKEGSRLPTEMEIATMLQVSRGSVREAIKSLQRNEILISSPGTGTYVSSKAKEHIHNSRLAILLNNDEQNMSELVQVRYLLDPELAALAAHNSTPDQVQRLQHFIDKMSEGNTKEEVIGYGAQFHQGISEMSNNSILIQFYKSISEPLRRLRVANFLTMDVYRQDVSVHQAILNAIEAHDEELAKSLMKEHLRKDYNKFLGTDASES